MKNYWKTPIGYDFISEPPYTSLFISSKMELGIENLLPTILQFPILDLFLNATN